MTDKKEIRANDPLKRKLYDESYDICNYLSKRYGFDKRVIKHVHKVVQHYLRDEFKKGNSVDLKNFGCFKVDCDKFKNRIQFILDENTEPFFNNLIDFTLAKTKFESLKDIDPDKLYEKMKRLNEQKED